MAKKDFCFTYYDGDAARDMAHMNRLERGCYTDLIMSVRKFGHLTLAQIKKILSKDFEECWPSLELILEIDEEGKYFIEWVKNSIEKSLTHSKLQKDKAAKRWEANKENCSKNTAKSTIRHQSGIAERMPLGDVYGNEKGKEVFKEKKEVVADEKFSLPVTGFFCDGLDKEILLTKRQIENSKTYIKLVTGKTVTDMDVGNRWEAFKIIQFGRHEWYKDFESLLTHFRNSYKLEINNGKRISENITNPGTSAARMEALRNW